MEEKKCNHQFKAKGDELVKKIKEIIHAGNVRKIIIKNKDGKIYLELPVTVGLFGVLLAPAWAAIGTLAAVAANYTIVVINTEKKEDEVEPKE